MITLPMIKHLIEQHGGIDDLSTKRRGTYIVDHRYIFYGLCKKYLTVKDQDIANYISVSRVSVNAGIKHFNNLLGTSQFEANRTYSIVDAILADVLHKTVKTEFQEVDISLDKLKLKYASLKQRFTRLNKRHADLRENMKNLL